MWEVKKIHSVEETGYGDKRYLVSWVDSWVRGGSQSKCSTISAEIGYEVSEILSNEEVCRRYHVCSCYLGEFVGRGVSNVLSGLTWWILHPLMQLSPYKYVLLLLWRYTLNITSVVHSRRRQFLVPTHFEHTSVEAYTHCTEPQTTRTLTEAAA